MTLNVRLQNLGTVNKNVVTLSTDKGSLNIYFSYSTPVAVNNIVSENVWSVTTGKLLNELQPDKKKRVPHDVVMQKMKQKIEEIL